MAVGKMSIRMDVFDTVGKSAVNHSIGPIAPGN